MARQPFSTVNPTPEKRLEGNAPSPALGAYRGRSGSLLPSSHRHCFQRQGDWLTNHRSEAFTLHPQTDSSGQTDPGPGTVDATLLGARTAHHDPASSLPTLDWG